MKFFIRADYEIDIDDNWLQEMWETEPVEDQEADALKVAAGTLLENSVLSAGPVAKQFDPVQIRQLQWKKVERADIDPLKANG